MEAEARRTAPRRLTALGLASLLLLTACTSGPSPTPGPSQSQGSGTGSGEAAPSGIEPTLTEEERLLKEGPSDQLREQAARIVSALDVSEQAGQVLVGQLGAPGTSLAELQDLHLGGVILMQDAIPTDAQGVDREQLDATLQDVQAALSQGREHSGVIAVDQEGGLVARVQAPLTEWPTPLSYGAALAGAEDDDARQEVLDLTEAGHRTMAGELLRLGFTVDFAPSVDVTVGTADPAIGARSFGQDPDAVTALGAAAQRGLLSTDVLSSPKHFPGHGSVTDDSHETMPVQEQTVAELGARDWQPFTGMVSASRSGEAYAPMLMMGHLEVPELEAGVPSSVSPAAYAALRELGGDGEAGADGEAGTEYDGVVVTDALNMGALVERYGPAEAPVRALAAGADLLLMPSDVRSARDAIVESVRSGQVPEDRLEQAATRVVTMLLWRDALTEAEGSDEAGAVQPDLISQAVSAHAVTVVTGQCGTAWAEDSIQIVGGSDADRARLAAAAQEAGLSLGSGPVVRLLGGAHAAGSGDVVVSLDAPYGLAESTVPDDGARIALYGRTPGAFAALVDVLTGQEEAPGALPVPVGEWPVGAGC